MKLLTIVILMACVLLTGCETLKNLTKPQYKCQKCNLKVLMLNDARAKANCTDGGRHVWRRIQNR